MSRLGKVENNNVHFVCPNSHFTHILLSTRQSWNLISDLNIGFYNTVTDACIYIVHTAECDYQPNRFQIFNESPSLVNDAGGLILGCTGTEYSVVVDEWVNGSNQNKTLGSIKMDLWIFITDLLSFFIK